jgi:hypothetical protein
MRKFDPRITFDLFDIIRTTRSMRRLKTAWYRTVVRKVRDPPAS